MTGRFRLPWSRREAFDGTRWRLHIARLDSYLRNARIIRNLADDAREKCEGDFVFDHQYTGSMVDRTIEHLDGLFFDAELLGADSAALEKLRAGCLEAARGLYAVPEGEVPGIERIELFHDDPEYRHLAACWSWMEGAADQGAGSAVGALRRATDLVFSAIGDDSRLGPGGDLPRLEIRGAGARVVVGDLCAGLEGPAGDSISAQDVRCTPLGLLLMGASSASEGSTAEGPWFAVIDHHHLSLRRLSSGAPLFLEATHTAEPGVDWFFAYERGRGPLAGTAPAGVRVEPTERGAAMWNADPALGVEDLLVDLGAKLFAA